MAFVADAIVGEIVSQLVQVVESKVSQISDIKDNVDDLIRDLKSFNAYLMEAAKNQNASDNEVLKVVVDMIRETVSDAEDVIGKFIAERENHRKKGVLRYLEKVAYLKKVSSSAREIEEIIERVRKIRQDNEAALQLIINDPNRGQPPTLQRMAPIVAEEDDVVGFDEEAKTIKKRLMEETTDLKVISIEGMAGLGKTTLTRMVFNDRDLQYKFFTSLWIYVSRTFVRKQIFLDILSKFTKKTKEFHDMSDESLAEKIREILKGGKYFIVMDDVWTEKDWKCLQIAFPDNKNGSRVLVTTRHHNVASHVDTASDPHQLKFLTNDESWELLRKKVFRKEKCPSELESTGKRIAIKCNGLPLAVVVIAGVLKKESTPTEWKEVAEDPFPVINKDAQEYNQLVKLSYNHLSYYMKNCFLYLAAFPIGHEIAVWKLIRLWIAEGFIPQSEGGHVQDLERTAEKYLKELVDKNLLMVLKRRADGRIKTCRIHDTLHEFCKTEAGNTNLFQEIDGGKLDEVSNKTHRRICLHSSIFEFMESENKPHSEHVRSLLAYCPKEIEIRNDQCSAIPKSFPHLRVMDVEDLRFKMLPKELYNLFQLKYLAISSELKMLPKLFDNLWSIQTLVFNSNQGSLEVKSDIWSMPKLRHVHCNTSMQLPTPQKTNKRSSGSTDLRTLSTVSPSSCTWEIFDRTPNLQKLGIRGNIEKLTENKGGVCLFDNLERLRNLENLKLINDALQGSGKLGTRLPRADKFPRRLRKLTLTNTSFNWKDFCLLGSLEELEVLKLEDNAFMGELCDTGEAVFKNLHYLRIGRTNLVEWTVASERSFPVLKHLILRNCSVLDTVPSAFGKVKSLKVMDLFCTNRTAAKSAQAILDSSANRFELSIYPLDHRVR